MLLQNRRRIPTEKNTHDSRFSVFSILTMYLYLQNTTMSLNSITLNIQLLLKDYATVKIFGKMQGE